MNLLGIILFAISLSMDALGIGISYGLRRIYVSWKAKIIICIISMTFTGAAVLTGNLIISWLSPNVAKIIGCSMLAVLGIFFLFQAFVPKQKKKHNPDKTLFAVVLKPLGITVQIIRNPVSCDFDKSSHIDAKEAIYLGVALSIDSFGAGVSSVASGLNSFFLPVAAGVCQLIFLCTGNYIGKKFSSIKNVDPKMFVAVSGTLLIFLANIRFFL